MAKSALRRKEDMELASVQTNLSRIVPKKANGENNFYTAGQEGGIALEDAKKQLSAMAKGKKEAVPEKTINAVANAILKLPEGEQQAALDKIRSLDALGKIASIRLANGAFESLASDNVVYLFAKHPKEFARFADEAVVFDDTSLTSPLEV